MQDTTDATELEFLPHHFLLCSVGTSGVLRYQVRRAALRCAAPRRVTLCCAALRCTLAPSTSSTAAGYPPQDTSTGRVVATHRTKQGPCGALRANPWNGVLCLGHGNGTVTMWTPNITTPVVRMLCHHGPVRSLAVDREGRHMVTTGADAQASAGSGCDAWWGGAVWLGWRQGG